MLLFVVQLEEVAAALEGYEDKQIVAGGMQIALNCTRSPACSSRHHPAASRGSGRPGVALLIPTSPASKERRSLKPSSQY